MVDGPISRFSVGFICMSATLGGMPGRQSSAGTVPRAVACGLCSMETLRSSDFFHGSSRPPHSVCPKELREAATSLRGPKHHFCHILLVKGVTKGSSDARVKN